MTDKLDEMWAALAEHQPAPSYAEAWATMLKERTEDAAVAAAVAALVAEATAEAARTAASAAADSAADAASWTAAAWAAQRAIDAIKEVQP